MGIGDIVEEIGFFMFGNFVMVFCECFGIMLFDWWC